MLAGTDPERILEASKAMLSVERAWVNPFGDGTAGQRIIKILLDKLT
jgi:UDP-N-acetylglucosamine 2-epimerase (non-hydrolysing)